MPNVVNTTISKSALRMNMNPIVPASLSSFWFDWLQIAVPFFVIFFTFILFGIEPQVKSEIG